METALDILKRVGVCLLTILMIIILASCGEKEVDMDALESELLASSAFTVDMSQKKMPDSVIPQTYIYEDGEVTSAVMYFNGDTVEEILLVRAADESGADHMMELCQGRIDSEKSWMESYSPEAVQRLENAVLVKAGSDVVMVVADDGAAAKTIVDKYVK